MSHMDGLRIIDVDLDAYLEYPSMTPIAEAEIFIPLLAIRKATDFVVKVTWPGPGYTILPNAPFRLERTARRTQFILKVPEDGTARSRRALDTSPAMQVSTD